MRCTPPRGLLLTSVFLLLSSSDAVFQSPRTSPTHPKPERELTGPPESLPSTLRSLTRTPRAPLTKKEFFTLPSDYRRVLARIPSICKRPPSSCGNVRDGVTVCGVYTPASRSCSRFCLRITQGFSRMFQLRCRRRGRALWMARAMLRCLSACRRARQALRRAGGGPHALVRVTYRNRRLSARHLLFRQYIRRLKSFLPARCRPNDKCSAARARIRKCSPRICREERQMLAGQISEQSCWFCHWTNTRCDSTCTECKPFDFCWGETCGCGDAARGTS